MNEPEQNETMSEAKKCPQCQAPLPAGVLEGLCPACLLKQGATADSGTQPEAPLFEPPPVAELTRLFPQLEIVELIGKGGMGAVYKARQPALDRLVALKILPPQVGSGPGFTDRFTREARALARLSHPNIVAVHEFGQVNGLHYFIMEFVDGTNLRQLEQAGRLSPREALQIVPQICDALQYAHDEGVVHRDIKPENVLVDRKGRIKIADFGLAKILGREPSILRLTGEGQVMGTPHYMAPEQVEHPLEVDHRADIYALGVVFYEMLTGELPLGKFAPPSKKVQVDVRLDEVVLRSLEKEPEQRYQHASQVKSEVENIAATPPRVATSAAETVVLPAASGTTALQGQVKWPAIGLLITGILNWLLIPLALLIFIPYAARSAQTMGYPGPALLPIALTPLVLCSFMIWAALKMMRFEAWWAAVIASILAIVVTPGNFVGLPVGIWALVVLSRREVRQAFKLRATGVPLSALPSSQSAGGGAWKTILLVVGGCALLAVVVVLILLAGLFHLRVSNRSQAQMRAERAEAVTQAARERFAAEAPFTALLTQGSVELVAVSRHPAQGQPWWKPDGSPSDEGPFENTGSHVNPGNGQAREFVVRLRGLPKDASWPAWKFEPSGSWSGSGGRKGNEYLYLVAATFPPGIQAATFKVGVALAPWETAHQNPSPGGGSSSFTHGTNHWSVSFANAQDTPKGTVVTAAHAIKGHEIRVVAVDSAGAEITTHRTESHGSGGFTQLTATFENLPLTELKAFRLQVRPYQWVEFHNVSLEPGQRTQVEIVQPAPRSARQSPTFGPAEAPGTVSWGAISDGLQMGLASANLEPALARKNFHVSFQNAGEKDVMLNLGITLANGKVQLPEAISLVLTDPQGQSRQLKFSDKRISGIGGRVDDYIVSLPVGGIHTLRLNLDQFWCPATQEFALKLGPGHYRLQAQFEGKGASHANTDTEGMRTMNFWNGTLQSNPIEFDR